MPHQVIKATVKGSKGDLARITAALKNVTGPNGEKVNILHMGGGESSVVRRNRARRDHDDPRAGRAADGGPRS